MKKYTFYFAITACYISLFVLSCTKEYHNPPSSTSSTSSTAGTTTSSSTTSGTTSSTTSGTTTSTTTTTTTGTTTSAPCSPGNNSYSGTNAIGSGSFTAITGQSSLGYYAVQADITSYPALSYVFLGSNPPASGKYITTFLPTSSSEVAMQFFVSGTDLYQDLNSDTIYVTQSGSQIVVTACGATLMNPSTFATSVVDSKITKP